MRRMTFLLLFLYCAGLFANPEIDSLETVLKTAGAKNKAALLNKLAYLYLEIEPEMSLECSRQACELAQEYNQKEEEALAYHYMGIHFRNKQDYPASIVYYRKELEIRKILKNETEKAKTLMSIANVFTKQGDFQPALDYYFQTLEIMQECNDESYLAMIHNNIGICYNRQGNYEKALEHYYLALELKENLPENQMEDSAKLPIFSTINNIGNVHLRLREFDKALQIFEIGLEFCRNDLSQSNLLNNMGIAWQETGEHEKALSCYEKALEINRKLGMKDKIAVSLNNIGYLYDMKKDWATTLKYYQNALELKREIGDQFGIANCLKNVGSIFLELRQYQSARQYLQQSSELAAKIGAAEVEKDSYRYLSRLYAEQQKFKSALEFEQKYSATRDSLFHETMAQQLASIETNYKITKAEKEKENLLNDNLLYKIEIQKANLEKLRYFILILLLLLLSLIVTFAYFQKRAIARILMKAKHDLEVEVEKRTGELARTNVELLSEIEERKKAENIIKNALQEKEVMLREIHHRVKNNLQVISSILNLQSHTEADDKSQSILENTRNRVYSMSLIHEKLYLEQNLAKIDFKDYIKGLLNYLLGNYQYGSLWIDLQLEIKEVFLNLDTAIPCGLLINEIFTNSVKHAFPEGKEGIITLRMFRDETDSYHLIMADNGSIITSESELVSRNSIGMKLIRLLAKQINSEMNIDVSAGVQYYFKFREK